jgi:hypothetical protein
MKISGGLSAKGVVVGNTYDKYHSGNPIVRRIMRSFDAALSGLVRSANPTSIHEIGCGEGYWVMRWLLVLSQNNSIGQFEPEWIGSINHVDRKYKPPYLQFSKVSVTVDPVHI